MSEMKPVDVVVIGAGPAGAVAAAFARQRGLSVRILEKSQFPRFVIGESLLAQCMCVLDEAGMMEAVERAGFQRKSGAQVVRGDRAIDIRFSDKHTAGYGYAYDVKRADFDWVLAREAERQGAELLFQHEIRDVEFLQDKVRLSGVDAGGTTYTHSARFVLDASGFGRVLPRLLGLSKPSGFPVRVAVFTHVEHNIDDPGFSHDKVRITIHPEHRQVSYWLIPFADGSASIGVVAPDEFYPRDNVDVDAWLWQMVNEDPGLSRMMSHSKPLWPARAMRGYSTAVTQSCGDRYALLGNAAGFLDPVFSSGVTLAVNSAKFAVNAMARELAGEAVDWQQDFVAPMEVGLSTCRDVVDSWYSGELQDILLSTENAERIYRMLCGVLGGYVWDQSNPYVGHPARRLHALAQTIRNRAADVAEPHTAAH